MEQIRERFRVLTKETRHGPLPERTVDQLLTDAMTLFALAERLGDALHAIAHFPHGETENAAVTYAQNALDRVR